MGKLIDVERERALSQSGITVGGNAFGGGIPNPEGSFFEEGDQFVVPQIYEVFNQVIGDNSTQFTFVKITNKNTGVESVKRLYPSTFTKSRAIANEDGTLTGARISASGTAVALYRSQATVEEGMCTLKGKKLEVTKVTPVRCLRYGTTQVVTSNILTIDIVEDVAG